MTVLRVAVCNLRLLARARGQEGVDPAEQRKEILDRLDALLSYLPGRLRDLLTGSKDAEELFTLLEGKGAGDAEGIGEAVEALRRREAAKAGPSVGRNAPCPCGARKPDGDPVKFKHCCGNQG